MEADTNSRTVGCRVKKAHTRQLLMPELHRPCQQRDARDCICFRMHRRMPDAGWTSSREHILVLIVRTVRFVFFTPRVCRRVLFDLFAHIFVLEVLLTVTTAATVPMANLWTTLAVRTAIRSCDRLKESKSVDDKSIVYIGHLN